MDYGTGVHVNGWPEAVVFDLDGTLIDSAADLAASLNEVLRRRGLAPFSLDTVRTMIGGGVRRLIERAFVARGVALADIPGTYADMVAVYAGRATALTTLYDGAEPLLRRLAAAGVRIGLCTNKTQALSEVILRDLGVAGYFSAIVGARPDLPHKPDPAPLRATLDALGAPPHRAVMVGDSIADAGTAKALRVKLVLVSYGYAHGPVEKMGGDAVIDRLGDLPGVFAGLMS